MILRTSHVTEFMPMAHQKVKSIFLAALQIDGSSERDAYVADACGTDPSLRKEVGSLLSAHEEAEDFLVRATDASISESCDAAPALGTSIGPYKIREQIGEGGMGVVYLAEQREPVQRKVALKIIKIGMASQDVMTRFAAERQALAIMDHPNIARVFDGGTTEAGQPYFVMELVQGPPLTDYCDRHKLKTRERLELFEKVCCAVQHAHQKGVIHRDLKPSNILVPQIDGTAAPKVIDFGVAKAVDQKLTKDTVYTQFTQLVGTPAYMSPEQAELGVVDVDTRSDVYSLGVLLYEVLTGSPPFDGATMQQAGFDEMRRMIREEDPPRPSARVSTLAAKELSTVATLRSSDPKQFSSSLKHELDWLVMKALEKDRNRRYESPGSMAADIKRYLKNEPIIAGPPSRSYRIRKYVQRNRAALLAILALFVVMVAGIVATTHQMFKALNAEHRAIAAAEYAQKQTEVLAAVNQFLNEDLIGQADPEIGGDAKITLREVIDRAAGQIAERFRNAPLAEAASRDTIGRAYHNLGLYESAIDHLRRASYLRREQLGPSHRSTLTSLTELARAQYGMKYYSAGEETIRPVVETQTRLFGLDDIDTMRSMNVQASIVRNLGRRAEAAQLRREILSNAQRALASDHLLVARLHHFLGIDLRTGSRQEYLPEAEENLRTALRIYRSHNESMFYLGALCELGDVVRDLGRRREAIALYEEAEDKIRNTLGPDHPWLIAVHSGLARTHDRSGNIDLARHHYEAAVHQVRLSLGSSQESIVWKMRDYAWFLVDHGSLLEAEEACEELERVISTAEQESGKAAWRMDRERVEKIKQAVQSRIEAADEQSSGK